MMTLDLQKSAYIQHLTEYTCCHPMALNTGALLIRTPLVSVFDNHKYLVTIVEISLFGSV